MTSWRHTLGQKKSVLWFFPSCLYQDLLLLILSVFTRNALHDGWGLLVWLQYHMHVEHRKWQISWLRTRERCCCSRCWQAGTRIHTTHHVTTRALRTYSESGFSLSNREIQLWSCFLSSWSDAHSSARTCSSRAVTVLFVTLRQRQMAPRVDAASGTSPNMYLYFQTLLMISSGALRSLEIMDEKGKSQMRSLSKYCMHCWDSLKRSDTESL